MGQQMGQQTRQHNRSIQFQHLRLGLQAFLHLLAFECAGRAWPLINKPLAVPTSKAGRGAFKVAV
jgi:hypothetical protein